MCRAFFVYSKNRELARKVAIAMSQKSYEANNRDGYFFLSDDKYVRTLSYSKFIKEMIATNSKHYLCHLRMATHGNSRNKNIHGWKFRMLYDEFYCCHNGVVHLMKEYDTSMSDTYNFYKHLENSTTVSELKKRIEENVYGGGGIFLAANKDFSKLLVITVNEEAYAQDIYSNNDIISVISSKKDVLLSKHDSIITAIVEVVKKYNDNVFVFKRKVAKRVQELLYEDTINIDDTKTISIAENKIYLIERTNDEYEITVDLDLEVEDRYYRSYHYSYFYRR